MSFSFKSTFLSLDCPIIQPTEAEEEVRRLLLEKSSHRQQLLEWTVSEVERAAGSSSGRAAESTGVAHQQSAKKEPKSWQAKIEEVQIIRRDEEEQEEKEGLEGVGEEGEEDEDQLLPPKLRLLGVGDSKVRTLDYRLASLCVPRAKEMVDCSSSLKDDSEHLGLWRILLQILQDAREEVEEEEEEVGLVDMSKQLDDLTRNDFFLRDWTPSLRLIPRDVEKEVRKCKVIAPTQEQMDQILRMLGEEIEGASTKSSHGGTNNNEDGDKFGIEKIRILLAAMEKFDGEYQGSYLRWIEKQESLLGESGGLGEVPELGAGVDEAKGTLQRFWARLKRLGEIRDGVLEIDEMRDKVEKLMK